MNKKQGTRKEQGRSMCVIVGISKVITGGDTMMSDRQAQKTQCIILGRQTSLQKRSDVQHLWH